MAAYDGLDSYNIILLVANAFELGNLNWIIFYLEKLHGKGLECPSRSQSRACLRCEMSLDRVETHRPTV